MDIPGLYYYPNFINDVEQRFCVNYLDSLPWTEKKSQLDLIRRTQQYGFTYSHRDGGLLHAPPIPDALLPLKERLKRVLGIDFQHLLVNEYLRNQGVAPHIDSPSFGPIVCSVSLLEGCPIILQSPSGESRNIWLDPCSLLVLSGESRYQWKHAISDNVRMSHPSGITANRTDNWRRISLTFRTVNNQ